MLQNYSGYMLLCGFCRQFQAYAYRCYKKEAVHHYYLGTYLHAAHPPIYRSRRYAPKFFLVRIRRINQVLSVNFRDRKKQKKEI